jgi:soluble lytic murein transglycosylase-like protein
LNDSKSEDIIKALGTLNAKQRNACKKTPTGNDCFQQDHPENERLGTKMKRWLSNYRTGCVFILWLLTWVFFPPLADADIYMYRDNSGVMHFSNVPTTPRYRLYVREAPRYSGMSASSSRYDHLILDASRRHGISFPLIKAIIRAESSFNPRAVSKKGAMGLMQLMPESARSLNVRDPFNPQENIMAGSQYFRQLMDRYKGKLALSLSAYNAGPRVVDRYMSIPPIAETERYVEKVLGFYRLYKTSPGN